MAEPNAETGAENEEGAVEAPKKSKLMLFLMIPILLVGMGGGAWIAYSAYPKVASAAAVFGLDHKMEDDEEAVEEEIEYGEFYEIPGLIINPKGTNGIPILMVSIGLEGPNPKVLEELELRKIVIEDKILRILSSRTPEQLTSLAERDSMKTEILDITNQILQNTEVKRAYFTKYVIQ